MEKKGSMIGYIEIGGAVLTIVLIIVLFSGCSTIMKACTSNDLDAEKFKMDMMNVANQTVGSVEAFRYKLDEESAIIGMNPGKDFWYTHPGISDPTQNYYISGNHFKRPYQCAPDMTCICICKGLTLEKADKSDQYSKNFTEIACKELKCAQTNSAVFQEKTIITDVFKDAERTNEEEPPRQEHYWDSSVIILRSSHIQPQKDVNFWLVYPTYQQTPKGVSDIKLAPIIVSGYRDFMTQNDVEVVFKKVSDNPRTVSICMKDFCV